MIDINTSAIVTGVAVGLPMAVLFFWGLNWGMRKALASSSPGSLLMLSFFVRMTLLLGVGLVLTRLTESLWALAGYMLAFLTVLSAPEQIRAILKAEVAATEVPNVLQVVREGSGWLKCPNGKRCLQ